MNNLTLRLSADELDLLRQWFNAVSDLNPLYMRCEDYGLIIRILEMQGRKIPESFIEHSRKYRKGANMSNLTLYEITSEMLALLESPDVPEEQIEAVFGAITEKSNKILHFRADILGEVAKFKAEEARLLARRKAMENLVTRLEGYIKTAMERLELEEATAGTFSMKLQDNPPAVEVADESLIPAEYFIVIPAENRLDKKKVADAIKAGKDVPGCLLTRGKSLRIR